MRAIQITAKMFIQITLLICALMATPSVYAACAPDLDKNIQKILKEGNEKYRLFGLQLSILCKNDTVPHDFAIGPAIVNGNDSLPVSPTTLFQIGSLTKSFTASLILKLEADGVLSINDEIGKWLPQIPVAWKKITIKQLLNHTSGIEDYSHTMEFFKEIPLQKMQKQWQPSELLKFVDTKPLKFNPGEGYFYSNTNYLMAGMVVEMAAATQGKSYSDLIQKEIIESLFLTNTYYWPREYSESIMARMAHSYNTIPLYPLTDFNAYNMSAASTSGAIISTAHDVAIWFQNLMHGNVLPAAQFAEMKSMVDEKTGQPVLNNGYGFGIYQADKEDFQGETVWMHRGQGFAGEGRMYWLPCRDIVVTMTDTFSITQEDELNHERMNMAGDAVLTEKIISDVQQTELAKECGVKTEI